MLFNSIRYIALAAAALLILLSWFLLQADDPDTLPDFVAAEQKALVHDSCNPDTPCVVEINDLLRMADTFDGAYVSTTGLLIVEFEGDSLYQSLSAYESRDYRNAIWVNLLAVANGVSQLSGTHVRLTGQFHGAKNSGEHRTYGHMGLWPGEIEVIGVVSTGD